MVELIKSAEPTNEQIASLQNVIQRIAATEHPEKYALIKQLLFGRIRELEQECTPVAPSRL